MRKTLAAPWHAVVAAFGAMLLGVSVHAAAPRGLIVELKDAPEHAGVSTREAALQAAPAVEAAAVQRERLLRVIAGAGLVSGTSGATPGALSTRPQGRAAFVVDFGRPLAAAETAAMLARLQASPEVAWAEPNDRESLQQSTTPSDPFFPGAAGQWWLQPVGGTDTLAMDARRRGVPGLQRAWTWSTGSAAVPVAVLDTGVTAHAELQGAWLPGMDLVSDAAAANDGGGRDADPTDPGDWVSAEDSAQDATCASRDSSWHGTVVSGILAARTDNNQGVAAVGWDARIVPVRVAGKCGAEVADIIDGMRWAAGLWVSNGARGWLPRNPNPVRVINLSFGGNRPCSRAYQGAIDELRARGVLVVAAAGNGQSPMVTRPASCRGVVAVAALNRDGFKARYSNFGPEVTLATVGGDDSALLADGGLLTLYNAGATAPGEGVYARSFGTSFATPIVAGTAALMLAVNPQLSVGQLIAGLKLSSRPHVSSPWLAACSADHTAACLCTTDTCGAGMLDAEQALHYARDPAAYVQPARSGDVLDNPELAAAGQAAQPAPPQPTDSEGTGGGALALWWLLGLGLALRALRTAPRTA